MIPSALEPFEGRLKLNKNISPYFTMRMHTVAEYYLEAETREDIVNAVKATRKAGIPLTIIGGGSNIAVTHAVIPGLVVRNLYQVKKVITETDEYAEVEFSSGYPMSRVVRYTVAAGYSGFEYHLGLPGTIGGGIYMNSKWTKPVCYIGDNLISAIVVDKKGSLKTVQHDYFKFAYDYSILQETGEIVLEAIFRLKKTDAVELQKRANESQAYRHATQPHGVQTSGCFYQNVGEDQQKVLELPSTSAGYLIDKAGLKGERRGAFVVSDHHANFIINQGDGEPEDLKDLMTHVKATVKQKYGVELKEEVVVI
ncbi:MAG: UDP-N-acetylmuramate dehydrogenase [Weeksellaceae bacterium]